MTPIFRQLPATYQADLPGIASIWVEVLARACGSRSPSQDLKTILHELVERILQIVGSEPFHPASGQELGARLVALGCGQSQSLAQTQRVLWRELNALVPATLQPEFSLRLGAVLAEMAAGFTDQMRRRLLSHQEEIRDQLLVARKAAEEALRGERDFVNAVLDTVDALILVTDAEGHILRFNRACEELSGYSAAEVEGKHAEFLVSSRFRPALRTVGAALETERSFRHPVRFENRWRTRSGASRQISWSLTALYTEKDTLTHYIGTGLDVTEQRAIEAELKLARRKLALAEEAERVRLAQDLHDDAVQQLLGLSYQLADMQGRAADETEWTAAQRLEEVIPGLEVMRQEIVSVAQGLRRLIGELRPPGLRDIGLREGLQGFTQVPEWTSGASLPLVHLDVPRHFDCALPESIRNCLFRVAQEALWNVRKHAAAGEVAVTARCENDEVWLQVRDNGRGFEVPVHLHRFAVDHCFGLLGMQERVAAEGGEIEVRSRLGKGTDVRVRIPIPERGSDGSTDPRVVG